MAYQYPLNGGRINASVGGNSTSAGAGYSLISTGTMLIAGGNNITLSQNGSAITISGANAPTGSVNFSAGANSANLASVTFSNSNGVSFGLNGSTITGSHNGLTSQSNQALSASNGSFAFQTAGFSNANGVTFGTSAGSIMTASVNTSYAASNHSHGNPTLNLTNISGTTASASNGLTLSLSAAAQSAQTQSNIQGIIASGSTNRTGDISFANSNGITFGLSNNTITASVAAGGGGGVALYDGVNSISSGTARVSALGALTASVNGQTFSLSAPAQSSISGTGIISISRNASTISIGAPAFSAGMSTIGNTLGTTGTASNQIIFAGGNNITLSQSTGAGGNTISIIGAAGGGGGTDQLLYVNGNGAQTTGWQAEGGNYTAVDDQPTNDGDTTRLYSVGANDEASFTIDNTSGISDAVNSVTVHAVVKSLDPTTSTFQIYVRIGGTNYYSDTKDTVTNNTTYVDFEYTWTLNPATSSAWTTSEIDGLEIGVKKINTAGQRLTQMYVEVNHGSGGGGSGFALANSQTTYSSGTAHLSVVGGALTIASTTGQSFNFSAPAQSNLSATGIVSISNNGNTISIGASVPKRTMSFYQNMDRGTNGTLAIPFASMMLQRLNQENDLFPGNLTANTVFLNLTANMTATSLSSSHTVSVSVGIYSDNATNLSLINSASTTWGLGAATGNTSNYHGPRWLSFVSSQWSSAPTFEQDGDYVFGIIARTANYAPPLSYYGQNYMVSNQRSGFIGTSFATNTSLAQGNYWNGVMNTTALPTGITSNQVNRNNASAIFIPHVVLNNRYTGTF